MAETGSLSDISMSLFKLQLAINDSKIREYIELPELVKPIVETPLERMVDFSEPNNNVIIYLVENDLLPVTYNSMVLAVWNNNDDVFKVLFQKYILSIKSFVNTTSTSDATEKNKFVNSLAMIITSFENNLMDLFNLLAHFGKLFFIRLLNDIITKETNKDLSNILNNLVIYEKTLYYAVKGGHLDIVKYFRDDLTIGKRLLHKAAHVAIRYNKPEIYNYLFENGVEFSDSMMDVCVFSKKLDLLKNFYAKYQKPISIDAIKFCMDEKLIDIFVYLVSETKLKYTQEMLQFCVKNDLSNEIRIMVENKIYPDTKTTEMIGCHTNFLFILDSIVDDIPNDILLNNVLPVIFVNNSGRTWALDKIKEKNLQIDNEFLNNVCLLNSVNEHVIAYLINMFGLTPDSETLYKCISTSNVKLVRFLVEKYELVPTMDIFERAFRNPELPINSVIFLLSKMQDINLDKKIIELILRCTMFDGRKNLEEIKQLVEYLETTHNAKFNEIPINFERIIYRLSNIEDNTFAYIMDKLNVDPKEIKTNLDTIICIGSLGQWKYIFNKYYPDDPNKFRLDAGRFITYKMEDFAKEGKLDTLQYLMDLGIEYDSVKITKGLLSSFDDSNTTKRFKKSNKDLDMYFDFLNKYITECKTTIKRKFDETNE